MAAACRGEQLAFLLLQSRLLNSSIASPSSRAVILERCVCHCLPSTTLRAPTHTLRGCSHPRFDYRPELCSAVLQVWLQLRVSRLQHAGRIVGPCLELVYSPCPQVVRLAQTMALDTVRTELSVRNSLQTVRVLELVAAQPQLHSQRNHTAKHRHTHTHKHTNTQTRNVAVVAMHRWRGWWWTPWTCW